MQTGGAKPAYIVSAEGVSGPWSEAIDALFADCNEPSQPGVNLLVSRHGEVVHRRGYGVANVEDDVPFTPDTVLHLGSTTKHICATCVLILEDRGLMSLDDPITRWIDGLPAIFAPIRLRHLLNMTSGLPDGLNLGLFAGLPSGGGLSQAMHLAWLRRLDRLMFPPGTGATYSNSNFLLVSRALEKAANLPLPELMAELIFEPLGMSATRLAPDPTRAIPHKARGYVVDAEGRARAQTAMVELCGDGGVVTTLADMQLWAKAYADGRLARDFRARLEAEARMPDGSGTGYALGMGVGSVCGLGKLSHGGGMPGYLADFAYVPAAGLSVVWLANRMDPRLFERTDRLFEMLLATSDATAARPGADPDLARLTGVYVERTEGATAEFEQTPEGTVMHVMGERVALTPTGPAQYRPVKASAYYPFRITQRTREGRPILKMQLSTAQPLEFEPWAPEDAQDEPLAGYVGDYASELMGEVHHVRFDGEALEVTLASCARALLWRRLKPRGGGLFSAVIPGEPSDTDVTLLFHRGGDGRVEAFDYNLSRNRCVRFRRVEGRG